MNNPLLIQGIEQLIKETPQAPCSSFADWRKRLACLKDQHSLPWAQALFGGYHAGCVGYAFAAGYQAALRALIPALPPNQLAALCVTEENGNHPKAIATSLEQRNHQLSLTGAKKFITGGQQADYLLVAAKFGHHSNGLPNIKLVKVSSQEPGVQIHPMPPLPFVPEIDHATVSFEDVSVNENAVLPGDGYTDYVKPFRTVEDLHVCLSLCGYLFRVSTMINADTQLQERLLSCSAAHIQLSDCPATAAATHLLLAGARQQLESLILEIEPLWQQADSNSFQNWQRDKALLKVAGSAREKRTHTAWHTLSN